MSEEEAKIVIKQGQTLRESRRLTERLNGENGPLSPINITDDTFFCDINDTDGQKVGEVLISVTDGADGWMELFVDWSDTNLELGTYLSDILWVRANGDREYLPTFEILVERSETKRP